MTSGNPLLAPLAKYGGPTPTKPPLLGSPAIDAGSDSATYSFATDQRGLPRFSGSHVDIGAVELQSRIVTSTADAGAGSLREAVALVESGATIIFASNLSGQTILLTSGAVLLTNNLSIDASALPGGATVSGNSTSGIFSVGAGVAVSLAGLTLTSGNQYDGGAIYSAAGTSLTVSRYTLSGNTAVEGGAILNDGTLVLNECTLAGNFGSYGGALQCRGPATISQSTLSQNTGFYGGGGIWIGNSPVNLNNSIIAGNAAPAGTGKDLDLYIVHGALVYSNANLVPFVDETQLTTPTTGPAPLTNSPMLAPLGNYGGPFQTMPPLPGSPAIDACTGGTSFTTDQRGAPRIVGPFADLGASEFVGSQVSSMADNGAGSLRQILQYSTPGAIITFAANLSGATILLTSGQLQLNQNPTIDGSGLTGGMTLNGNAASRIFEVESGTVVLNSLTLSNGNAGLASGGGLLINGGTVTLNQCSLAGNAAADGGGISGPGGTLTLNQCTLALNSASDVGGGIALGAGTVTLNQCTLSANSAANVGGGIFNGGGSLVLSDCIVAGNTESSGNDISGGANYYGANLTSGSPLLAPLAYHGGPTPTMPPLPGSPAIDACTSFTSFTTDQRGAPRIVGPFADLGAAEFVGSQVTSTADNGIGSLRQISQYSTRGTFITFAPNLSGATILLTNGEVLLDRNLTIDASALTHGIQINGHATSRIFEVAGGSTVVLNSLTIANGYGQPYGGGIYNSGTLTVNHCTLYANTSTVIGGGIWNHATLTVNESTLTGNRGYNGSGIANTYPGTVALNQSTMSGNRAILFGLAGSIYNGGASFTVSNSMVADGIVDGVTLSGVNLTGGTSLLAPLGNYGGPTQTMPPLPGSPAIDACTNGTSFATDQRGFPRVAGRFADVGAVEGVYNPASPGTLAQATRLANGSLQLGFTNISDMTFTVLASTNVTLPLDLWSNVGFSMEAPAGSGQYQFTDPQATNSPQRFYRVRWP
ncbi:MAG: hypothetical protein NT154_37485 [Verrucomicrobia bacterium]|nr:hypothetical protein [Verrucomicrobiota bacterium]